MSSRDDDGSTTEGLSGTGYFLQTSRYLIAISRQIRRMTGTSVAFGLYAILYYAQHARKVTRRKR